MKIKHDKQLLSYIMLSMPDEPTNGEDSGKRVRWQLCTIWTFQTWTCPAR